MEAVYEGERRSITGVIRIAESRGEEVRAQLMRNLKSLVQESKRLRDLTRQLALSEDVEQSS